MILQALRTAYAEPIPKRIVEAIRLEKMGEKKDEDAVGDTEADAPEKKTRFSATAVEALEVMLVRMEANKRPQAPPVRLIGADTAAAVQKEALPDDRADLLMLYDDDRGRTVKRLVGQTYTFYVTLGEPLQQALSIRKFNRFLRDIGLVPTKGSRKMMIGDYGDDSPGRGGEGGD